MKRIRCPKCENYLTFDETKYEEGQSLVFECVHCGKQFAIRLVKSKMQASRKQEKIDELYSGYQDIEYYENKTKIKGNTLTSTTLIDYNKVNTDKLIEIDNGNASVIKNGKVEINNLEKLYKQNGCNCKKEG